MLRQSIFRKKKGFTLIELLVVISVIGILGAMAIPQVNRMIARSIVRAAATDTMKHMTLARTLAVKENLPYMAVFNAAANTITIGTDTTGDGFPDTYGSGGAKIVDLQIDYANSIVFGTATGSGPGLPGTCACTPIGGPIALGAASPTVITFNTDQTVEESPGSVFIMHNTIGFTYMIRISARAGNFSLWKWDGDFQLTAPATVTICGTSPQRYCTWTEIL